MSPVDLTKCLEYAPDAQLATDGEGVIQYANQRARQWLGEELVGQMLTDYAAGNDRQTIDDFLEGSDEAEMESARWAVDIEAPPLGEASVDLHVRVVDQEEQQRTLLWSLRSVERQTRTVEANQFTAARLKAIVEQAVNGIITIDGDGVIETFNSAAEEMFGYEADEVIGEKVNMLMPEPYRSEHDEYMGRYHRTGVPRIIGIGREVEGRRKDGSTFPMDLAVSELETGQGTGTHYTGIVRDVTRRQEAKQEREALIEQLEEKNAELERFTYTVSHDLKSPLITIKGFVGMLEQDAEQGNMERLRQDIARISGAADKMKQLLDELLELSRIGRVVNPSEEVDLTELARSTVRLLSGPIEEEGVEVVVEEGMPTIYGDRVRLQEVFQNLIENAVKFMGEQTEPTIEIGVDQRDGREVCYVRDNGIGVEPRYIDKVFGLFEQLDQDHQGSGVGLTLVHRIVDVHGGEIWVESEGLGEGATFCFTFHEDEAPGVTDA